MPKCEKYYWLKLKDDFFSSKRIKKLRRLAGGDTYTIIYLKLQLIAMKNDGYIAWTGLEDDFADELALDLDEDPDNIKVTLSYLLHCGLAETSDNVNFYFPYAVENTGSETTAAIRQRKSRTNRALSNIENMPILETADCDIVTPTCDNVTQNCDNVTPMSHACHNVSHLCHTEIEIEKEIDIEIDKEKEIQEKEKCTAEPSLDAKNAFLDIVDEEDDVKSPYETVKEMYNTTCTALPKCKQMPAKRKAAIKARLSSGYTLQDFQDLFTKASQSSFLCGGNERNWRATLDWLITDLHMAKVIEGNYDDREVKPNGQSGNGKSAADLADEKWGIRYDNL